MSPDFRSARQLPPARLSFYGKFAILAGGRTGARFERCETSLNQPLGSPAFLIVAEALRRQTHRSTQLVRNVAEFRSTDVVALVGSRWTAPVSRSWNQ